MSLLREYWGPNFWMILHTLAEYSGSIQNINLSNDEADAWSVLLKYQGFVMPCTLCKKHYMEFKLRNPVKNLRELKGDLRKTYLRNWLWTCHDNVNKQSQKESPSEDVLEGIYSKKSIKQEVENIYKMFQSALERSQLQRDDIKRWKASIIRLQLLYGL